MISMKDIALKCGVSVATVSKALNDHHDIGEETKAYIKKVAQELDYHPNSSARALKTNRSYNLGVLFVDEAESGLTHDYFSHVLDSFKRKAEQNGYDITFINCSKAGANKMTYLQRSRYRGFDGVVIACVNFLDPEVIELVQSEIPVVTIDHLFNNCISIMSDNVNGMKDLVTYICSQGHRKVAFIHGEPSAVTTARLSSFYRTMEDFGIDVPDEYVRVAPYRNTHITAAITNELLALPDPPTCIIFPDDFSCYGGINAINEKKLRIPEDISVAGYDGIKVARHIEPTLTTIRQDTGKLGGLAAEKLISLIEKPKTTIVEQVIVPGTLVEGKTIKNLKETAS